MTTPDAMIRRAREIHLRLINPPNAVPDSGIDLKRKKNGSGVPPTPQQEKKQEVLENHIDSCRVTIITYPPPSSEPKQLKTNAILRAVSDDYGITIQEIKGRNRQWRCVEPRHIVFYLVATHTGMSLAAVGRRFDRDHTSIMHACNKVRERMMIDEGLTARVKLLEAKLFSGHYDQPNNPRSAVAANAQYHLAHRSQPGLPESQVCVVDQSGWMDSQGRPAPNDNRPVQGQDNTPPPNQA